jgi:hypothetical protein
MLMAMGITEGHKAMTDVFGGRGNMGLVRIYLDLLLSLFLF